MIKNNITEAELSGLRREVQKRLSEKRFRHTLEVEREAVYIAEAVIPEKVMKIRAAAILHDVAKEISSDKQLNYIKTFDIIKVNSDSVPEPILHALAAPAVIISEFSLFADDEILSAVRCHTTGRSDMTVFDAVIFTADYTEATRKHESCRRAREFLHLGLDTAKNAEEAKEALRKTVMMSLSDTLSYLKKSGGDIDPETEMTYNSLLSGRELK